MDTIYRGRRLPDEVQRTMGTDNPCENYLDEVRAAIKKVMDKYIVTDFANLPLKDRALSVSIVHDAAPKHSPSLEIFLEKQLPEILRVTDRAVYIYPISIYKVIKWWAKYDSETGEEYWKKLSDWTPDEIKEEKRERRMNPEDTEERRKEGTLEKTTLEESHALYKDPEVIKQISAVAEKLGFEFKLENGNETDKEEHKKRGDIFGGDPFVRHKQKEAMLGIFTRKNY